MRMSDGAVVPGNAEGDADEIALRVEKSWRPIGAPAPPRSTRRSAANRVPVLLGVHSFTPSFKGRARPWPCGVLWDSDRGLPRR